MGKKGIFFDSEKGGKKEGEEEKRTLFWVDDLCLGLNL